MGIMGSKLIKRSNSADDKADIAKDVIARAKRKYGYLSKRVRGATTPKEMGPALRALARDLEVTDPNKSDEIMSFHRMNGLTGLHPEPPVAP
jgi:hypothetical protein